jgi:hypothetical protein
MTAKEVADLLVTATGRTDFYWNFFVVILIALIGWLFSLKKPLTAHMKTLVTVGYLIAALMNLLGLFVSYSFAEALRVDLIALLQSKGASATLEVLQSSSFGKQRWTALAIHILLGIVVLWVVWRAKFGEVEKASG